MSRNSKTTNAALAQRPQQIYHNIKASIGAEELPTSVTLLADSRTSPRTANTIGSEVMATTIGEDNDLRQNRSHLREKTNGQEEFS